MCSLVLCKIRLRFILFSQHRRVRNWLPAVAMDFLKSAVASAISKGPAFGYTFGDRVDLNDSIWTLHNGTKRVWPAILYIHARAAVDNQALG